MATLVANNFLGNLTRAPHGSVQSGNAIYTTSWGYNNFGKPGCLSFMDAPYDISNGIVTDAVIDGQSRVENGINYVYAIGHTGRLYKIQVNNPNIPTGIYDVPSLLATLTTATSFTMGGSLYFHGDTEKIYIGHDEGVTSVNFDGSGETFVGSSDQWVQNVPRQGKKVGNNLYYSNGSNIALINSMGIVVNYNALYESINLGAVSSSEFIIKDIDLDRSGKELIIVSSTVPNTSILDTTPNINTTYAAVSNIALWDMISPSARTIISIPSFDQTAAVAYGGKQFVFGYDLTGGILSSILPDQNSNPIFKKLLTNIFSQSPLPNAANSNGNICGWMTPQYDFTTSTLAGVLFLYGSLDQDWPDTGFYRQIKFNSTLSGGDVLRIPFSLIVSNFQFGGDSSGYGGNVLGFGRMYYSTVEYDGAVTSYGFFAYNNVPTGSGICTGVYETQASLCNTGTYTPTAARVYIEPAAGTESFSLSLIGIAGTPITNGTHTFSPSAGETILSWTTTGAAASAAIGFRVTNISTSSTPVIHRIELDYNPT